MQTISPLLWIKNAALPLWMSKGIDWKNGGFFESLELSGEPRTVPKRAMVQARMLYSLRIAREQGWIESKDADRAIQHTLDFLLSRYPLPNGAFRHSVDHQGRPASDNPDLYAQAFAIFGLAQAYSVTKNPDLKKRALAVVDYLKQERQAPAGGFSELVDGRPHYQSNPHMHLFEAFLAWLEIDSDPVWRRLSQDILDLCLTRFIDRETGFLGEHFDASWRHIKTDGRFVAEPGHQFEWAWLMNRYRFMTKASVESHIIGLIDLAEQHGVNPDRHMAYDEIWSDGPVKTATHRFWPQGERVKAHSVTGDFEKQNEAMMSLTEFFRTAVPGLWYDRMNADGQMNSEPSRASSLYHIIGAIADFEMSQKNKGDR